MQSLSLKNQLLKFKAINNKAYSKKINPINRLSNYFVLDKDLTKEDKIIYEGIQSIKTGDKVKYKLIKN
jgi:hypothetical protein